MTTQELNRDIKRLKNLVVNCPPNQEVDETYMKKEIRRLFYADDTFEYMNRSSILTLIRLNGRFRAIPLHVFGLRINLDKL